MTDIIHENENYRVIIEDGVEWYDEHGNLYEVNYAVVNRSNGVTEFFAPQLSAALFNAENFNSVLIEKPYMWQADQREGKDPVGSFIEGESGDNGSEVH